MEKNSVTDQNGVSWTYETREERDGDGFYYNDHFAISSTGEERALDWSRFDQFQADHFERYVLAGMPERQGIAPWHPDSILAAL